MVLHDLFTSSWFPSCIIFLFSLVSWDICHIPWLHYIKHLICLLEDQLVSLNVFVEDYFDSQNLCLVPQMYCLEKLLHYIWKIYLVRLLSQEFCLVLWLIYLDDIFSFSKALFGSLNVFYCSVTKSRFLIWFVCQSTYYFLDEKTIKIIIVIQYLCLVPLLHYIEN